jgi:Skp family chaperone for outer membrane proteins
MKKILLTTLVVLVFALVVAIVYCVTITKDRDSLNTELKSVQSVLTSTQAELYSAKQTLDSTHQTLATTQAELGLIKQILTSTQLELGSTKQTLTTVEDELKDTQDELEDIQDELEDIQDELDDTQDELEDTQDELEDNQDELDDTQDELEVAQETLAGLGITLSESKECYDAELIDNPSATNPTWSQLMTFLSRDKTEKNTYIEGVYDCSEFSRDVHNNAEAAGIRASVVHVWFEYEDSGHALNAFLTTDYGLVYVDCSKAPDTIARVKTGKEYRAVEINRITGANARNDSWWNALSEYYYIPSSHIYHLGGEPAHVVTLSINIYW